MKILFVFNGDFIEGNASNARLKAYGKYLQRTGTDVEFLVLRPSEFSDQSLKAQPKGELEGLSYHYLSGKTKRQKGLSRFIELLTIWASYLKALSRNRKDATVIYFYGAQFFTHFPILVFTKVLGYKSIIELTELHSLKKETNAIKTTFARLNNQFIEWTLPLWFHHVFLTTRRLLLFYKSRFKNLSISIMPVVVDFERFENLKSSRTNTIGYLGSFAPKDGVEGIIQAYAKTLSKHQGHIKLKLIGYQPKDFDLENLLIKNGLSLNDGFIEATGKVSFNQIPVLLSSCDLLLMNRTSEPFSNYGFPIKLAEYMATGKPCICTNVSDIEFYFKNGMHCQIIAPDDTESLSEKILERYELYDAYNLMGKNGRERVIELFSAKRCAQAIQISAAKLLA
jgi:glycosyltransferase involved in cell wall biosynthesis